MQERFEAFTVLITRIGRSIKRIKAEEMADFDLKGPYVSCLYYLSQAESMTSAELCERCDEDKAAISRSLDYLQKTGLVICGEGGTRRYKNPLSLSAKGREVCRGMSEKIERIVAAASAGLNDDERHTMYRALTLISDNLDAIHTKGIKSAAESHNQES